ncbi:hypothetical protein A3A79_02870 [Candidatus Gottesmanbacteria bacterium RIFCSPLOWO2_01_FULL_43_11b]|uniref:DUF5659 domain-containing protein n=1 Tax=Candidatus Gottesmanbacteria bacterium RIFCSPLOWO2_01_FULL_43_11b TaxID=1798392 RepID=A0A1F6AI84_9BACT|nr:MAG: hypothetical protein A3A79_02870 [Candidatus Gottesmanbacteria bacterium RIFCSPLOWO2_01_FULL_43_11b]
MTRKDKAYKTQDIFEASWIYSQNARLIGLEPNGKYSYFVFDDSTLCEHLSTEYWAQQAVGNIKEFVNSLKTLKDLLFSQKGL